MQNNGNMAVASTCTPYFKRSRAKSANRLQNIQTKENYSAFGCCNAFLKTSFKPIPQKELFAPDNPTTDYLTQANYEYLRDSAIQYAKLLNVELQHIPGADICNNISNLYKEFQAILDGRGLGLNIEINGPHLVFAIYEYYNWGHTLLWLPVKFINSLNGELQRIAISFIAEFARSNGILPFYKSENFMGTIEELEELYDQHNDSEEVLEEYRSLLLSYRTGEIYELFQKIQNSDFCKKLPETIRECNPEQEKEKEKEKELIRIFEEGLQFIGENIPSIRNYEYNPDYDPYYDYDPIDFDSTILLIYDDDLVTQNVIERINCIADSTYVIYPHNVLLLSPETDKLFLRDDYPDRFEKWFLKLCDFLYTYYE